MHTEDRRLKMARIWILIVFSYYFISLSYKVLPYLDTIKDFNAGMLYFQMFLGLIIFIVVL